MFVLKIIHPALFKKIALHLSKPYSVLLEAYLVAVGDCSWKICTNVWGR
jgi:hypothetical protein